MPLKWSLSIKISEGLLPILQGTIALERSLSLRSSVAYITYNNVHWHNKKRLGMSSPETSIAQTLTYQGTEI